jgi:S-formylglutathione hydrolase FrmB
MDAQRGRGRALVAARLLVAALALAISACGAATAEPVPRREAELVAVERTGNRQLDVTVASPAVGREVRVRLLLPRDFHRRPAQRWPVLYLLHGCCDGYKSWTRSSDVERLSRPNGVLVVMPDAGRVGFYSDWRRGPQWERFHLVELRRLLERHFRGGSRRAIAGLSMGGLGAMLYAAREPKLFRAAASYSGLLHTRLTAGDSQAILGLVASQGEAPLGLWGDPDADASRWAVHNPYDRAADLRDVALFVAGGDGQPGPLDPPDAGPDVIESTVLRQSRAFVARLRELDIAVSSRFYGGGTHSWPYWQRELHRSWPLLMDAIGA